MNFFYERLQNPWKPVTKRDILTDKISQSQGRLPVLSGTTDVNNGMKQEGKTCIFGFCLPFSRFG